MDYVRQPLQRIQSKLAFEGWGGYPQFSTKKTLGRTALLGLFLGVLLGAHLLLLLQITLDLTRIMPFYPGKYLGVHRLFLLWQWCAYVTAVCSFHLLEFFVTAFYNPTEATADSFLINHSIAYTAAALTSWTEFGFRFLCLPRLYSVFFSVMGLCIVVLSQMVRSLAMATAGESFNHLIQTAKKDNHVLITNGVYSIFRHPSYVGFYYWSVGTQLLLGNPIHSLAFCVVSWSFFKRRIEFEEESLCQHFPGEYQDYVARTWMGIPFLRSHCLVQSRKRKSKESAAKQIFQ